MLRYLRLLSDSLVYGPSYGVLNFLIHSPSPLEPAKTWKMITVNPGGAGEWLAKNYPPSFVRRWLLHHKIRQDHRLGIAAHYDVPSAFYELFLDRKYMFYTCADHINGDETLEEAQAKKADHILSLIDPHPGEKILELGCGWGSMMKRIVEATGDRENLTGYTLSQEQVDYNVRHNHFNVEYRNFITTNYPTEYYDKIYSIGAWEHVRPQDSPPLLAKLYRALKPGGRLMIHFFCRLQDPLPAPALVSQLFFPGSVNSSLRFHRQTFQDAGFRIAATSVHDYRHTLRDWFNNLVSNREQALALVGTRVFNRYLVFFASAWRYFNDGTGLLFRFVLQKPTESPGPLPT